MVKGRNPMVEGRKEKLSYGGKGTYEMGRSCASEGKASLVVSLCNRVHFRPKGRRKYP